MKKLLLSTAVFALLITGNAWGGSGIQRPIPVLSAGNITQVPVIDGKLNDSCWKNASGAVMLPARSKGKLTDQSRFLISYDDKNLYIGAELYQSYLHPVYNMVSRTKPKCNSRDDGLLFRDDGFEVFLKPQGSDEYYHFAFNMNAVVYDEKGTALSDVSKKWNSSVKAVVKTKKTKWILEIAIPLKDLGVKKSLTGQSWKANFCRGNAPKKEAYAWSPPNGSFHKIKSFGKIIFSSDLPRLQCRSISTNKKVLSLTVRGGGKQKIIFKNCTSKAVIPANKFKQLKLKALQSKNTGLNWISAVAGGKEIMRTPSILLGSKTFKAPTVLKISDAQLDLFVNGQKASSAKNSIKTDLSFAANKNVLAIELTGSGVLSANIAVNGLTVKAGQLLFNRNAPLNWKDIDFNDSQWSLYKGQAIKGKAFFRYTFLNNFTLFAPQLNNNTFYMANDTSMLMRFRIGSPYSWKLKNYSVTVKLPEKFDIPIYDLSKRAYKRYFNVLHRKAISNGTEYQFVFPKAIPALKYNWGFHVINFILKSNLKGEKVENFKGQIYIQGHGTSEIPRDFKLCALPELKGRQPKNIQVLMMPGNPGTCFSSKEGLALIPILKKLGCNQAYIHHKDHAADLGFVKKLKEYNIISSFLYYGYSGRHICVESWKKFPEKRLVNNHYPPKSWNYTLCPLAFMEDDLVRGKISSVYKIVDVLCDDMERGIVAVCMCDRCRKLFAKRNGLKNIPSEDEIYSKYEKELADFQVWINKYFYDYFAKLAKNVNPDIKRSVYSGYDSKRNRRHYGIDWQLYKDIDYPTAGYLTNTARIKETRKAMGGRSMICGYLISSSQYKNPYDNQKIKAVLFHQLINSGFGGVMMWTLLDTDGRGQTNIAEFSRGVAEFEEFLNEKYEISSRGMVKGVKSNAVRLYKRNDQYLLVITNIHDAEYKISVKLPENMSMAEVFDFYGNKTSKVKNSFKTKIKAYDALIFKIKPTK